MKWFSLCFKHNLLSTFLHKFRQQKRLLYTYYETAYLIGRAAVTWDKIENDYSTTF